MAKEIGFTMDYSSMPLLELKQHAKRLRIKQYYIMKRRQLIELLSMKELPQALIIEKYTIHQLRDQAKERNIRGFWNLRRDQLVELLYQAPTNQNEKNEGNANKHDEPQQHDAEKVGIQNMKDA